MPERPTAHAGFAFPRPLRQGDRVRFVSPGSPPDRAAADTAAQAVADWGYEVDFGPNAFNKFHYLAGTDEERLADLNGALRDPSIRAIITTRGGKGSYRIADRLDFEAARRDPKFLMGFSDITALHLALLRQGVGGSIHGAPHYPEPGLGQTAALRMLLMGSSYYALGAESDTTPLTTGGRAEGPLIGGNLDTVTASAGWALPPLEGCILLLEEVDKHLGHVDRQLTMLRKAGHLAGLAGIAFGQFCKVGPSGRLTAADLLRDHLAPLGVPMLGGLPIGHGPGAMPVPLGRHAVLDVDDRTLRFPAVA